MGGTDMGELTHLKKTRESGLSHFIFSKSLLILVMRSVYCPHITRLFFPFFEK